MKEKVLLEINRARVDLDFDSLSDEQYIIVCERLASIESALEEAAQLGLHGTGYTPCAECGETTAEFLCKKCWRELSARP